MLDVHVRVYVGDSVVGVLLLLCLFVVALRLWFYHHCFYCYHARGVRWPS